MREKNERNFKNEINMEGVKMFLFGRWIATCYADEHLDSKMKSQHEEGFNGSEGMSVLNIESGIWWKKRLEFFNNQVYPNYLENGTVDNTIKFLNLK